MSKKNAVLILCLLSYPLIAAVLPDLAGYRDLSKSLENPIIFNESFDQALNPEIWIHVPAVFQQVAGQGYNGTGALYHERLNSEDRLQIMRGNVKLEHGVEYRCSFKLRSEDYHTPDNNNQGSFKNVLSMVNVIYRKNGKWSAISSSYSKHRELSPGEWQDITHLLALPNDCDEIATIDIYLRRGVSAKVWLDDLSITVISRSGASVYPLNSGLAIDPERGEIRMGVSQLGQKRPEADLGMIFTLNEQSRYAGSDNDSYSASFAFLPPGAYQVKTQLIDSAKKEIISTDQYPFSVPARTPSKGTVTIDTYKRTLVDGKAFMPIAIFSGFTRPPTVEHLREWKAGGFNSLMYYHPIKYLYIDGKKETQAENILSSLDLMEKHELKFIFSLFYQHLPKPHSNRKEFDTVRGLDEVTEAVVNLVKDHPAILAYYISDENPLEEYPAVRALRERISRIDPWHPTVTLTCAENLFESCAKTGDILSWDYYPVRTSPLEKQTFDYTGFRRTQDVRTPHWFTPQAMQWTRDREKGARSPQLAELRAMCYTALIFNSKGFMFYSYPSILELMDISAQEGRQLWQDVCSIATELNELSDWVLSLDEAPRIRLQQKNPSQDKPEVIARAFKANGKLKVLIVSNGPGAAQATLELPDGLRSRYGLCKPDKTESYLFSGLNVCADILEEP